MNQKKSGFTLIELMVSITIGAIIITSALSVYANFVQTKIQIDIARQMQKEINFALARVTDRVRNCEIENPSSTNSQNFERIVKLLLHYQSTCWLYPKHTHHIVLDHLSL